jgi:hypothetical protein
MSDVRDPGPEAVDKILDGLEEFVDPPAEVARKARRLRAHIKALRQAIMLMGNCGACGGSGSYKDKGFRGERGFVEEEVRCKKCGGSGIAPAAAAVLGRG